MTIRIGPGALRGSVRPPGSKSATHRALICAALAPGVSQLRKPLPCQDTAATARCLRAMGANIREDLTQVEGPLRRGEDRALDCGESGSTFRFLAPVAAALGGNTLLRGAPSLLARPSGALLDALRGAGISATVEEDGVRVEGEGLRTPLRVRGDQSSQPASGFLMALPLLEAGAELQVEGRLVSAPYLAMTAQAMLSFGVRVEQSGGAYTARGAYRACEADIPCDWSAGANWLIAGALGGDVLAEGLAGGTGQPDEAAMAALAAMGAAVVESPGGVSSRATSLSPVSLDLTHCPDLLPILAVAAAFAGGRSVFAGVGRLRGKESDRVASVCAMLCALGGRAAFDRDALTVEGGGLSGGEMDAHGDHRIAMAGAVALAASERGGSLRGAQCVAKSYPAFWQDFRALGGRAEEA